MLVVQENPAPSNPLLRWELVEQRGIRERVLAAYPSEPMARAAMVQENARRAQLAVGTAGTFTDGNQRPAGCTCPVGGIALEAVACPVHDV